MFCKDLLYKTDVCVSDDSSKNVYHTRFVYSSKVNPRQIDALMPKKSKNVKMSATQYKVRLFGPNKIHQKFRIFIRASMHVGSVPLASRKKFRVVKMSGVGLVLSVTKVMEAHLHKVWM